VAKHPRPSVCHRDALWGCLRGGIGGEGSGFGVRRRGWGPRSGGGAGGPSGRPSAHSARDPTGPGPPPAGREGAAHCLVGGQEDCSRTTPPRTHSSPHHPESIWGSRWKGCIQAVDPPPPTKNSSTRRGRRGPGAGGPAGSRGPRRPRATPRGSGSGGTPRRAPGAAPGPRLRLWRWG